MFQMEQLIFREHTPRGIAWQRRLNELEKGHSPFILGGLLPASDGVDEEENDDDDNPGSE